MNLLFLIDALTGKKKKKRKRKRRKPGRVVLVIPMVTVIVTLSVALLYTSYFQMHLLNKSIDNEITASATRRFGMAVEPDENIYNQIISGYQGGTSGKGIYDMAIALLNNEYLKDLLQLYSDAGSGAYDSQQYHLPKEQFLAIHYNESGVYAGMGIVPDGPFPVSKGEIQYNKSNGGLPAEASTWLKYNTAVKNVIGYNQIVPTGTNGSDVFIFQMNQEAFGGERGTANINGYNASSPRVSDAYYLPDQCVMLNTQFTEMLSASAVLQEELKTNPINVSGIMNLTHNRGSAHQSAMGLCYSAYGQSGALNVSSGSDVVMKEALVIGDDMIAAMGAAGYEATSADLTVTHNRALAVVLLMKEGWYVSSDVVTYYGDSHPDYFINAWNAVYPTDTIQSAAEVKEKLNARHGNLAKILGISAADANAVYRTQGDYTELRSNGKSYYCGTVFKVESYTNSAYSATYSNGSTPKQVHAYDVITAGHVLMGMNANYIWEMLMKYAMEESGIDPSDPRLQEGRFDSTDGFRTEAQMAASILTKLGIKVETVDENAFELLSMGLKASGGKYSQELRGEQAADGTYYRDCSNLVLQAIAWTSYGKTQNVDTSGNTATLMAEQSYLKEVPYTSSDWKSKIKPGDVLVRRRLGLGHTFIFVGFNQTSTDVNLDLTLTKRNESVSVSPGEMVTIEAYSDNCTNGVFSMKPSLSSALKGDYIIKRLSIIS